MGPFNSILGSPSGSDGKESTFNAGDQDSVFGPGRSPWEGDLFRLYCMRVMISSLKNYTLIGVGGREGNSTPLQYSCLENPMDGGAW